jgi:phage gp29-like protein
MPRFRLLPEPSDRHRYAGGGICTPEHLTACIAAANSGDIESLCLVGRDIMERNWDIAGAMEQRIDALTGCQWSVQPGEDRPASKLAAEKFSEALQNAGKLNEYDTFYDFCSHAMSAVVMPFAPAAIVWGEGGTLEGFQNLDPWNFTLQNGFTPRLITSEFPTGMPEELQRNGFIFHALHKRSDPVRQGHIRALAWLHVFQNWPIKDLMSFIERFGMPFVVAKVDQNAWDNERSVLHQLIRNFGPSGGGVFTKSTELELLQAANTGGDNVYFRALEFARNAIYTLIVGQLASSSDSSGMSNGDAQTAVRQDILESDARALESTILAQIAAPWTRFQFGDRAAPPELKFAVEPPENLGEFATVVNTLSQAGFKADAAELSERFGIKLRYEPPAQPTGMSGMFGEVPEPSAVTDETLNLKQKYDAMGVAIRAGLLTATPEIEEQTRRELGLPAMSPEVKKAWEATGGIRQPITLKSAESEAVNEALDVDDKDAVPMSDKSDRSDKTDLADALESWLGPYADTAAQIAAVLSDESLSEEERREKIIALREAAGGDSSAFEELERREMLGIYRENKLQSR